MNINPKAITATIRVNLLRRPLWRDSLVLEGLGIGRDKLDRMVDSGELAWAFDVGMGKSVKELRVLGHCVVEMQSGPIAGLGATGNLEIKEVLGLILPETRESLRATDLQRVLWVNADLIRDLAKSGALKRLRERLPKSGPNSSPHYTRASVAAWLAKRKIV